MFENIFKTNVVVYLFNKGYIILIKLHIKKVAFPHEHGSWGFVLEPLVLSLLVTYSFTGLLLAVSSFLIFLNHQPVRVLLSKKRNKQLFFPALLFFMIYSVFIVITLVYVFQNSQIKNLLPFGIAILLMLIFFILELIQKGRELLAEFIAPISITFIGMSIVLIGGWTFYLVIAFAIVLLARSIPTVLYIHLKVQAVKMKEFPKQVFYISEIIFLSLVAILAFSKLIPILSIFAVILLIGRAVYGLSKKGLLENIRILGIKEFIFGILYVVIVYIGYYFNL